MAKRFSFKKPDMTLVWVEVLMTALWLFFGDKIITVIDGLVGEVNDSLFEDAYQLLGIGTSDGVSNSSNGLLGIVALIMVVMIISNFISYSGKGRR